jgi:hypothetical protein
MPVSEELRKPIELDRLAAKAKLVALGRYPQSVSFPDGTTIAVDSWKDLTVHVVQWLGEQRGLPSLPFDGGSGVSKYFMNSTPHHVVRPMALGSTTVKLCIRDQEVYLDTGRSSENLLRRLCELCQALEIPPSTIGVTVTRESYPWWRR